MHEHPKPERRMCTQCGRITVHARRPDLEEMWLIPYVAECADCRSLATKEAGGHDIDDSRPK